MIEPGGLDANGRSTPIARPVRVMIAVLVAGALVRLIFAGVLPLFPDEAYYWEWSRHLAPGYFDHPPGVALAIRFGAALLAPFGLGATAFAVRVGPVLAGFVAALATTGIARRIGGDGPGVVAAVVMTVMPLAAAGLVLATPDAPLLATGAVALYCVVRALQTPVASRAALRWWSFGGLALGLGFASKYTSILLPVGVLVALALHRELRPRLREPGPWIASLLATLVFLPVLVWNAHHGWISFTYQLEHGLGAARGSRVLAALKHEGDLFGGQAGLVSPILFVLMIVAIARSLRGRQRGVEFMLGVVATIGFAFFVYSALSKRVEPNWPAPAYIPGVALLATQECGGAWRKWFRAGAWLAVAISLVVYVQGVVNILPVRPARDPVARAFGWDTLARAVQDARRSIEDRTRSRAWTGGDRYQEAAEIAFHDPSHPATFAVNMSGRSNQYDLWPKFSAVARPGDDLVLALDDTPDPHPAAVALQPYFQTLERGATVEMRRGNGVVGRRRLYLLIRWRGGWPTPGIDSAR